MSKHMISQVPGYFKIMGYHRKKLFESFLRFADINKETVCLDVGGVSIGFENLSRYCECISINLSMNQRTVTWHNIRADARFLPLRDKSVNYAISNSVIEHVEGASVNFSKEIKRVAKDGYFISCPYYYTPLEPHYFMPFIQLVPEKVKQFLIFKLGLILGHMSKSNYEIIEIPKPNQLKSLFPMSTLKLCILFGLPWDIIVSFNGENLKIE